MNGKSEKYGEGMTGIFSQISYNYTQIQSEIFLDHEFHQS